MGKALKKTQRSMEYLEKALEVFVEHGIDKASMCMVAESIGIKKPSLYHHFINRDDIIYECLNLYIEKILRANILLGQFIKQNDNKCFIRCLLNDSTYLNSHPRITGALLKFLEPEKREQLILLYGRVNLMNIDSFKPLVIESGL